MNTVTRTVIGIAVLCSLLLSGCLSDPAAGDSAPTHAPQATVYQCSDLRTTVYPDGEAIALALPEQTPLRLPRVISASGEKYEADGTLFWGKGVTARIEHQGRIHDDCRIDAEASAALKPLRFRALGNEPGWRLDIDNENRLRLLAQYGDITLNTPAITPISDGRDTWVYDSEEHGLQVRVQAENCADSMADQQFPATVTVIWNNQRLNGCGFWLPGFFKP